MSHSTTPSRISLFGPPLARTILPTLSRSLSITQFTIYPDYSAISPIAIRYPSSDYSGILFPIRCYPLQ